VFPLILRGIKVLGIEMPSTPLQTRGRILVRPSEQRAEYQANQVMLQEGENV
jgi:hypothetical protein